MTNISAYQALQQLKEGNQRFVFGTTIHINRSSYRRDQLAREGQNPWALILACMDSRVTPELIFDQSIGDLFVVRTAGQVIDVAVLGSIELAILEFDVPLVMVLGHKGCGAVQAAMESAENDSIADGAVKTVLDFIRPAIGKTRTITSGSLEQAVWANVLLETEQLRLSKVLSNSVATGKLKIVGACYDLHSGSVEFAFP